MTSAMPKKEAKDPKALPVHRRQFEKDVRIGLNPADRDPIVKDAAQARKDWNELKVEAATVAATYRAKLNELAEILDEALVTLSQGRPVRRLVEETRNFTKNTLVIKDVETGAIYEQRPMTDADAQIPISDLPNGTEDPNADPEKD